MRAAKVKAKRLNRSDDLDIRSDYSVVYFMSPADVACLLEVMGYIYPLETMARRLQLLTPRERTKIRSNLSKILDLIEEVDGIISNRAELAKDPWP